MNLTSVLRDAAKADRIKDDSEVSGVTAPESTRNSETSGTKPGFFSTECRFFKTPGTAFAILVLLFILRKGCAVPEQKPKNVNLPSKEIAQQQKEVPEFAPTSLDEHDLRDAAWQHAKMKKMLRSCMNHSIRIEALRLPAQNRQSEKAENLLTTVGYVNTSDETGVTVLMATAWEGNIEVVKLLLDEGADVNAQDQDGWTALMNASTKGHLEIVKLLLGRGANAKPRDKYGGTALTQATQQGHTDVVKLLKAHGAKE